jgi:hypothetical protein
LEVPKKAEFSKITVLNAEILEVSRQISLVAEVPKRLSWSRVTTLAELNEMLQYWLTFHKPRKFPGHIFSRLAEMPWQLSGPHRAQISLRIFSTLVQSLINCYSERGVATPSSDYLPLE